MQVAIHHVSRGMFFIVKWEDDSFKWDGYSFQNFGYDFAKCFGSEKEVVAACKDLGFTVESLLTGLPKKKEDEVWDNVQALLET